MGWNSERKRVERRMIELLFFVGDYGEEVGVSFYVAANGTEKRPNSRRRRRNVVDMVQMTDYILSCSRWLLVR